MDYPNISLLMPIFNRNNFTELIIENILKLNYDHNKLAGYINSTEYEARCP